MTSDDTGMVKRYEFATNVIDPKRGELEAHKFVLATDFDRLIKQRDQLQRDLARYGSHSDMCFSHEAGNGRLHAECDCGFALALGNTK